MSVWSRLFGRRKSERSFKAAMPSRLTDGWTMLPKPPNYDVRTAQRQLVARSREGWQNNPYIKRYVDILNSYVVGVHGVKAHPCARNPLKPGELDDAVNQAIAAQWHVWEKHHADVSGRSQFSELQRLVLKSVAIDGECFVRVLRSPALAQGIALQLIDSQYVDVLYDKQLPNGNYIMQGIEFDQLNREVAYYIYQPRNPTSLSTYAPEGAVQYTRISATDCLHVFLPFAIDQRRGVPMTANALEQIKLLDGYLESALVAARVGAANCGFFSTETGEEETIADRESVNGQLSYDAEPGTFRQLPAGVKLEQFKAEYPNAVFKPFVETILRQIASGLGISYTSLSNDISSVNYSSIRQDALQDRELYATLTEQLIAQFVRPVYEAWLEAQLLRGSLTIATKTKPKTFNLGHSDQLGAVRFSGRPFRSIDPQKDSLAVESQLVNGLRSRSDIISKEYGEDPDTVFAEIAAENAKLKELGLAFGQPTAVTETIRENL